MKREICLVFAVIFVFVSASITSAISTEIKDSYPPKETIITEISGSVLEPIDSANVKLIRGHVLVPFDYEIKRLGERYYLWILAPEQRTNYTLSIKGIATYVSGNVQRIDYEKNFSVSGNLTDYYVKPGFILTEKDFEVRAQLNEDREKEIELEFIKEKSKYMLKPGENIIKFSISNLNKTGLFNLSIGRYRLPVYIKSNKTETPVLNISNETAGSNLTSLIDVEPVTKQEEEAINKERAKYHCYEFPGKICAASERCSGDTIVSLDGACCVKGECGSESTGGRSYAWVGYVIAALVIVAGVVIYIKYKKIKAEKNPLEKKILSSEKSTP